MRCTCCNRLLNDFEATRRHAITNEFLDICNKCFTFCGNIPTKERDDLKPNEEVLDDIGEEFDESSGWDNSLSEVS